MMLCLVQRSDSSITSEGAWLGNRMLSEVGRPEAQASANWRVGEEEGGVRRGQRGLARAARGEAGRQCE